jgi:hypothetical protein
MRVLCFMQILCILNLAFKPFLCNLYSFHAERLQNLCSFYVCFCRFHVRCMQRLCILCMFMMEQCIVSAIFVQFLCRFYVKFIQIYAEFIPVLRNLYACHCLCRIYAQYPEKLCIFTQFYAMFMHFELLYAMFYAVFILLLQYLCSVCAMFIMHIPAKQILCIGPKFCKKLPKVHFMEIYACFVQFLCRFMQITTLPS